MSKEPRRARLAALKIAVLMEEFSPAEIAEAIGLLNDPGKSPALEFLAVNSTARPRGSTSPSRRSAVVHRPRRDAATASTLRDLEIQLRQGNVLPGMDDIRAFGTSISKGFDAGTARREAIPRLLDLLASLDDTQLRDVLASVPMKQGAYDEGYQSLARHLIERR